MLIFKVGGYVAHEQTGGVTVNIYQKVSVVVALILYLPLSYQILTRKVTQNLATFILWGSLDAFAGASIFVAGGNFQLPVAYVFGCTLVVTCILKSGNYNWTRVETRVSILVVVCLTAWCVIVWGYDNPWLATVLSTTGVVLGGFPQLRDSWRRPEESPWLIYTGYTFVNVLSVVGGKGWTVEERLYPFSCAILCGIIVLVSLRRTNR
ncbi:MAG: hypothetical protein A2566_00130 [Candidatus Zambryskibacteria bacterium RIFOXYD1_FULL_40_13]|nr:MAG: hypothetical protein UT25_C0004G0014 [Parcubacteria group bacterium GW2011_GWC1_39_12]KKR19094.1 MAG: hypothetical protein UT49_C0003G0014 [Parcubacteria group bacterium GW2011_GWF1_39_37]KKR34994.1 MAG: hypothetical protein UT68_C0006G0041 [Parcubacteria group bacterium GW2011_GWC2_40_10]KKR51857.1 MAG: hypothetical protein UT89_C0005G0014 [Parcubacteria group bacterium GW2011_GWE1_40_20]KKR69047.1 MAG: hypothetical protein UU11_C0003G0041 [Parcubacteria group bacterium GW2011_GWF2_40_